MPHRPDALKHLSLQWFALVLSLAGLSLAWRQAGPVLGDMAGAPALVLAALAALAGVALLGLMWRRWQRWPDAVRAELQHPARGALLALLPMSALLLAVCAHLHGLPRALAVALWWAGSLGQWGVTLWVLGRWLKPNAGGWQAVTPLLIMPTVGNILALFGGVALGFPLWATAQWGAGLLLWPLVLSLFWARLLAAGPLPEKMLPSLFITVAPPAVLGQGLLLLNAPGWLAWACWGMAVFFLLWSALGARRLAAQPFAINFWALGFPLAAFASLSLSLARLHRAWQTPAMLALALASFVVAALLLATWRGLRDGSLLQPETVAVLAVADKP